MICDSFGTWRIGPMVAIVGLPRKIRAAAARISASVTASILPRVSAIGISRPNTCHCRASCSQRLPVDSRDISSPAFNWARARFSPAAVTACCTFSSSASVTGISSAASDSPVPA